MSSSSDNQLIPKKNEVSVTSGELMRLGQKPVSQNARAVRETTERTRASLKALAHRKANELKLGSGGSTSSAAAAASKSNGPLYVQYTPAINVAATTLNNSQNGIQGNLPTETRILEITDAAVDPLQPARFRIKKGSGPKRKRSPPAPVLHEPARALTVDDHKKWKIPPCVSNWKNSRGYTIELDKRLAVDGRHLANTQRPEINDAFGKLSDALGAADRHAREEVQLRADLSKRAIEREETQRTQRLHELAMLKRRAANGDKTNNPTNTET